MTMKYYYHVNIFTLKVYIFKIEMYDKVRTIHDILDNEKNSNVYMVVTTRVCIWCILCEWSRQHRGVVKSWRFEVEWRNILRTGESKINWRGNYIQVGEVKKGRWRLLKTSRCYRGFQTFKANRVRDSNSAELKKILYTDERSHNNEDLSYIINLNC
jgi:hypothetical protein